MQEEQKVINSIPKIVTVELKEVQVHQKAQEDESEDQHKSILIPFEQAEENESIESDHSEILEGILLGGILGLCEIIDLYRPPDSKGSMNQSKHRRRSNKYL